MQRTSLALEADNVAELRELYRAAEARAARLRLMSASGRQLALAEHGNLEEILEACADRLAYFLGCRKGRVVGAGEGTGLPVPAPGSGGRTVARVVIDGVAGLSDIADAEDREACRLQLEMMGATIDRIERQRELAGLLAALQEREQRLEDVLGRLFTAGEEERRRVSRELHDGVAQTATALARLLEGTGAADALEIRGAERVRLASIARDLVSELRAVIRGLRPTVLDDLGLEAALRALAETLQAEGFEVDFAMSAARTWPRAVETALYRVAQEALANVRKHSGGPCRVLVELDAEPAEGQPFLRIRDFGQGPQGGGRSPSATDAAGRFGIDIMRERMAGIGGSLEWSGGRGGVTVLATFPGGT